MMSSDQMIATIKNCAEKLGRTPTCQELETMTGGELTRSRLGQKFGGFSRALAESGLERQDHGRPHTMQELFEAWARVARAENRVPTLQNFQALTGITPKCLLRHFRYWKLIPMGMLQYMEDQKLGNEWNDVADMIRRYAKEIGDKPWIRAAQAGHSRKEFPKEARKEVSAFTYPSAVPLKEGIGSGEAVVPTEAQEEVPPVLGADFLMQQELERMKEVRKQYGAPIWHPAMSHAPINEDGVLVLLGAMARQLGLVIMRIQKPFPDGEGMRLMPNGRWEHTFFEVELESRNFHIHGHDPNGCDFIICWEHNWKECPLPVIELRKLLARSEGTP